MSGVMIGVVRGVVSGWGEEHGSVGGETLLT